MEVTIRQTKTNLSSLIVRAEAGEEVIIARAGKPVVKLVLIAASAIVTYEPGALKGKIWFEGDDPFASDEEIATRFEKSEIFPGQ